MAENPPPGELAPLADPQVIAELTGREPEDTQLLYHLRAASGRFRAEAGHQVAPVAENVAVVLDGDGSPELRLPGFPVLAVSSVDVDGDTLVAHRDYEVSRFGMLRRLGRGWPDRLSAVRVVFTYGHPAPPADVADAIVAEVRYCLPAEPGIRRLTVGGETTEWWPGGVSEQWNTTVARYAIGRGDRA